MSPSNKPAYRAIAALLALLVAVPGCVKQDAKAKGPGAPPVVPVRVAEVTREPMALQLANIGSAEPYSTIMVKAQVSGELTKVSFKEGRAREEGTSPLYHRPAPRSWSPSSKPRPTLPRPRPSSYRHAP